MTSKELLSHGSKSCLKRIQIFHCTAEVEFQSLTSLQCLLMKTDLQLVKTS